MERARHYSGGHTVSFSERILLTYLQSLGWEHYEVHEPEPHILLFKYAPFPSRLHANADVDRRPINYQPPNQ